jgi:NADPH-dependent glutamate synthase beta subunit-like oxidoreductase/ferredoxin/coenzyme F420-reducing hydrogenase delta subunit
MDNGHRLGVSNNKDPELMALLREKAAQLKGLDHDYSIEIQGQPPCNMHCPSGVNAKAYVNLIAARKYEEAFNVILQTLPFPGVCGRICTRPCEDFCILKENGVVPIKELKRFVTDYKYSHIPGGMIHPIQSTDEEHIKLAKKVAVVGAGPAGLTAALDLAALNYNVTIYESQKAPGGMLNQGIPGYRLPHRVVKVEIETIKRYGIDIKTSSKIEDTETLRSMDYDAIILATGTMKDLSLPIPGIDTKGVLFCLPFLRKVNMDKKVDISGNVLVLGGGSSAFDCARSAKRMGAKKVTIVYRRTISEMPAAKEEVQEAKEEGIEILELAIPSRVIGEDKVLGMEFLKAELGDVDESKRRRPIPIEGSEFQLKADFVITAVGFTSNIADFSKELELTDQGIVKTDLNGQTNVDYLFAAGDVALGPSSVIEAIASAHEVAYGVHLKLSGEMPYKRDTKEMPIIVDEPEKTDSISEAACLPPTQREGNFSEVNLGFSEFTALTEAARCVKCASCFECAICLGDCTYKQIIGTMDENQYLIKCPISLSKKIYDAPKDVSIVSETGERKIQLETLTANVDSGFCIACGRCEESCPYSAVKVVLKKNEPMSAFVDHDLCKCCGACTGGCPTGAISQGIMSPDTIREKIVSKGKRKESIIFGCVWGNKIPYFSRNEIIFICTRMIRPSDLISALAYGNSGVIINPCSEKEGCHYSSFEPSIESIASATNYLLDYVGVKTSRIKVKRFNWRYEEEELTAFSDELKESGVKTLPQIAYEGDNRISRTLNWLLEFRQKEMVDNGDTVNHKKEDTVGLLALVHLLLDAEGFNVLDEVVNSIKKILGKDIYEKKAAQITIGSLFKNINIPKISQSEVVIGLIPSENKGMDIESVTKKLSQIKGAKIITLKPQENFDINVLNSRSKTMAMELFKKAEDMGINILVPLSIMDLALLKIYSRPGAWQTSSVEVTDVFTIISRLMSDVGGEP